MELSGCISLSTLGVEVRDLTVFLFLKYYNVREWESRFTLGLNAAKNTENIFQRTHTRMMILRKSLHPRFI